MKFSFVSLLALFAVFAVVGCREEVTVETSDPANAPAQQVIQVEGAPHQGSAATFEAPRAD